MKLFLMDMLRRASNPFKLVKIITLQMLCQVEYGLTEKLCHSLRDIDKALFAFHRLHFEPKLGLDGKMYHARSHKILTRARGITNIQLPPQHLASSPRE